MIRDGICGLDGADHDVCIVGAGPVGIALALEFSRLGRRVLLLESGGDGIEEQAQRLSDAEILSPGQHDPMSMAVARRLGGTSNLWGGRCLPFDPIDFERRAIVGAVEWPVGYGDLAPYYPRAIDYACAGADVFKVEELAPPSTSFTTAFLERWSARRQAQSAHRHALSESTTIDLRLHATVTAFVWDGDRVSAVTVVGRDGARTHIPVRELVLATGGLESTRILLSEQRQSPQRFGGEYGVLGRYYMGHVIGEIADIVWSSDAIDHAFDFQVDTHGSYVRRRIAPSASLLRDNDLLNCAFWPVVPRVSDATHRDGFLSAIALALSVDAIGKKILPETILRRHIPVGMTRAPHLANVLRDLRTTAREVPVLLWQRYGAKIPAPAFFKHNTARRYGLAYHSEQAPRRDSRVWLSDTVDATGLPRLSIDLRFCQDDARSVVALHDRLAEWLPTAGLGSLSFRCPPEAREQSVLEQASHGTHQIGTAHMSASPRTGVVDGNLRAWGSDNLYVASSATLPTSGQANPTLTVMALALRLASHLCARQVATPPREVALTG